jgi:hypothetical protein
VDTKAKCLGPGAEAACCPKKTVLASSTMTQTFTNEICPALDSKYEQPSAEDAHCEQISRSAAEGFLGPHDLHNASRLFFSHPQRRGFDRDIEAQRDGALIVFPEAQSYERSFFGLPGCIVSFLEAHVELLG